ncbi:EAL domain-containing protein [Candidatus Magnetaquicoccus inordinatus]|uniref:EAL domain-containing protein n=1 Tax=Candidatus Magnetaquicoccus inordinatus TaxID=2496818 RepID=UPI00102AB56F|nr:EAL domain-containing protein [Candidatus Magnetaquicoccus inordinatus]
MFRFLSLLLLGLFLPLTLHAEKTLVVGVYDNQPGVFSESNSGQIKGFYIDILERIAENEGWKLTYQFDTWANQLKHLEKGEIDLLVAIAYTPERAKLYDYTSEMALSNWGQLYVHDNKLQSVLDLSDKQVAGVANDIYSTHFSQLMKGLNIHHHWQELSGYQQVLQQVATGKADAGVVPRTAGMVLEKQYNNIIRSPIICCPMEVRYAAPKGKHAEILSRLDLHLKAMKADKSSFYYQSFNRWFAGASQDALPTWMLWSSLAVAGGSLLIVAALFVTKKRKEKELVQAQLIASLKTQESQSVHTLNILLKTALIPMSLEQQLRHILETLFAMGWFPLLPQGSIYLVDPDKKVLNLACCIGFDAQHLEPPLLPEHTLATAEHGGVHFDSLPAHGHYQIPIQSANTLFGLMNLYVPANHQPQEKDKEFLASVAMTIAAMVERKYLEHKVQKQAEIDELTGLPNRALFHSRLERAIAVADRSHTEVVLMFIDLDRFKQVNDTMGHKAGDRLLQEAANRLLSCVRTTDTVSRLGGDEFTIILPKSTPLVYVEYIALRIQQEMAAPFHLEEGIAEVSASIGITIYPRDGADMDQLLQSADTAMYHAKNSGRNSFSFFDYAMMAEALERMEIEKSLKSAMENEELLVFYQPKVNPASGRTAGMEALVRWKKNQSEFVSPGLFIPIAEQSALIVAIGTYVLRQACRQTKLWLDAGFSPLCVSVNLSVRQLKQEDALLNTLQEILQETGLPASALEVEITESMMMQNVSSVVALLHKVRELGIKISIDDFGTGYSSLSSLKHLPIQTLKIDRSFITSVSEDQDSAAIVQAIIALAKQLNLKIVAEGVENRQQMQFLSQLGCDEIQGYYYGKPMSTDDFTTFLKQPPAC